MLAHILLVLTHLLLVLAHLLLVLAQVGGHVRAATQSLELPGNGRAFGFFDLRPHLLQLSVDFFALLRIQAFGGDGSPQAALGPAQGIQGGPAACGV